MHRLTCRLRVSARAVLNGSRTCAQQDHEASEPTGRRLILARDELWHDVQQTRQTRWIWTALDQDPGPRLDWACGRRDQATLQKLVDRLASGDVQGYGTDTWGT